MLESEIEETTAETARLEKSTKRWQYLRWGMFSFVMLFIAVEHLTR